MRAADTQFWHFQFSGKKSHFVRPSDLMLCNIQYLHLSKRRGYLLSNWRLNCLNRTFMNRISKGVVFGTRCWIGCLHFLLIITPPGWHRDPYCILWAGNRLFNQITILMNSLILTVLQWNDKKLTLKISCFIVKNALWIYKPVKMFIKYEGSSVAACLYIKWNVKFRRPNVGWLINLKL